MHYEYSKKPSSLTARMCVRRIFCNFQVIFFVGISLGIQVLLLQFHSENKLPAEQGDVLYYQNVNMRIHHADFAKSVLFKLAIEPSTVLSAIKECDGPEYEVHDAASLNIRQSDMFQALGDSNVHGISGYLDDRLGKEHTVLRIVSVGLYPGPTRKLYCSYECSKGKCSSALTGVVLPPGTFTDSIQDSSKYSMAEAHFLVCPVCPGDHPTTVSITTHACGYSHNALPVKALDTQKVIVPPRLLGICIRPPSKEAFQGANFGTTLATWLEYLRYMGADQVFLYLPKLVDKNTKLLHHYNNETFKLITVTDWDVIIRNLEHIVSAEGAVMDCIYSNMMGYKHIMVMELLDYPILKKSGANLKQLVRSEWFDKRISEYGGFRIDTNRDHKQPAFIVKSRLILATAAQHFVALTRRPYYQSLDHEDIRIGDVGEIGLNLKKELAKHVKQKISNIRL